MPIAVGDRLPDVTLECIEAGQLRRISTVALFAGRRVLLFAVPGAFTPTCSEQHLPGYIAAYDDFARRDITVACVSVNDAFVMQAWGEQQGAPTGLLMLADGNGAFTRALGLELDASAFGMGLRSKRYALLADDGIVTRLEVDAPGELRVSCATHMLDTL